METNQNNIEAPQVIDENQHNAPIKTFPTFIILGALVIFISTAAVLFFNYQYSSSAALRNQNNHTQRSPNVVEITQEQSQPIISPTPTQAVSADENAIDNIVIDEGTADFSSLDQTAAGL